MVQRLQFPLNDRDYYNAKVSFQAFKIIPPTISGTVAEAPATDFGAVDPDTVTENQRSSISNFFSRANVKFNGNTQRIPLDRTSLFLPQGVTFQDGVSFDDFDLGRVGGAAEAAVQNSSSVASVLAKGPTEFANSLTDVFRATPSGDIARLAATRVSKIGGSSVAGGVQSALRVTSNPNKRVLFREVRIREFAFSFKLIPTSKEEAEEITKIIAFFRENLYPEDFGIGSDEDAVPIGYEFPNQFEIIMKHRDREIAHKILPSYLTTMQTTYNPTAMGFFEDGNFIETELNMTFREFRALSKRDITTGGY